MESVDDQRGHGHDLLHRRPEVIAVVVGGLKGSSLRSLQLMSGGVLNQTRRLPAHLASRYAPAVPSRRLHVLWKTQAPRGCSSLRVARDAKGTNCFEAAPFDDVKFDVNHKIDYSTFLARDTRTVALLRAAAWLDPHAMSIVDQRMLYWRSDAHVDSNKTNPGNCLHFCLRTEVLSSTFPRVLLHEIAARTGRLQSVIERRNLHKSSEDV